MKNSQNSEFIDERIKNIMELLDEAPLESIKTILDVGIGNGEISKWLTKKGKRCTGIGINIDKYAANSDELKNKYGINIEESRVEKMPFKNGSFDAVLMSHVLEHCPNIEIALTEVKRVLKDKGWLFIFVPPSEKIVCAGHITVGWNIGQLIYVLLLNGFDVKNGKFIKYGYNICGYVQKSNHKLPQLNADKGDICQLSKNNLFPFKIKTQDESNDNFFGDIPAVNWNKNSAIFRKLSPSIKKRLFMSAIRISIKFLPLKNFFGRLLLIAGNEILYPEGSSKNINPKILRR